MPDIAPSTSVGTAAAEITAVPLYVARDAETTDANLASAIGTDSGTEQNTVRRRSVFLIGGYEPKSPDAFFKRTRRELARFCETWQVRAKMGTEELSEDGLVATAKVESDMHGQQVRTDINFFVWNDLVLRDFNKPLPIRVAKYTVTFLDYLLTGTFFRIVGQAWRFSLYFLYPVSMLFLFCMIGGAVFAAGSRLSVLGAPWIAAAAAVVSVAGLLRYSGRRWFVLHLMDLWSFSRYYLRGQRPDAEQHIERFADAVVEQVRRGDDDEIVLVGHSTGGALILDIAARATQQLKQIGMDETKLTILTVGSTALKIGLHPAAVAFRAQVQCLVDAPNVNWVECQSMTDIVNFYKTDPVAAMNLTSHRSQPFPEVHLVRVRDMLQPETYKKFKYNFFRVHYQFIMANTKQYAYDFFMVCCGTQPLTKKLGDTLRRQ